MYTSNIDGKLREVFADDPFTPLSGFVGKDRIYYVSYNQEEKYSYLKSCDHNFKNCSVIHDMSGAIRSPVEVVGGRILFIRSPYIKAKGDHGRFPQFQFYFLDKTGFVQKVNGTPFYAVAGPTIYSEGQIHFSAIYPNFKTLNLDEDSILRGSNSYTGTINNNEIDISKNENNFVGNGTSALITKFTLADKNIYYAGIPGIKSGNYVYHTCIISRHAPQKCDPTDIKTSHPAIVGKNIYYAIWEPGASKVSIVKK
ncbi:MAG: hypothetical protein QM488_08150 [Rhizobiaceae bacterium]